MNSGRKIALQVFHAREGVRNEAQMEHNAIQSSHRTSAEILFLPDMNIGVPTFVRLLSQWLSDSATMPALVCRLLKI